MKKIVPIIIDIIIFAIIVVWGFMLFKEFQGFDENTAQAAYTLFNVKILLLAIFMISSITIAFYINLILGKSGQYGKNDKPGLEDFTVPEDEEQMADLSSLEELRKLLSSKMQMIDQLWDKYTHPASLIAEDAVEETALLKDLAAQEELLKSKNISELFDKVVDASTKTTDAQRVSLFLYNPGTKKLCLSRSIGLETEDKIEIDPEDGVAGYAFKKSKRLYVTNVENHPELGGINKPQYKSKSFVVFPIKIFSGVVIGVLNATEKSSGDGVFSMLDLQKMNLLVNSYSFKLENMILSKEYSKTGKDPEELKKSILEFLEKV